MYCTQPRLLPERIYEPNIIHNPFTWMGIWTPHGWRVHKKRWGRAKRLSVTLSGDGKTTFFPHALLDPQTRRVEWQDDLHLKDDPLTDAGIYPSDPRVEYPMGQPRWAISHTLLCYPVADHGLHTHEYTWDMVHGHLQTHFRKHVSLEEARTDGKEGMTVQVKNRSICRTIEGNVHYPLPNSAVRGVWSTKDKLGENFYIQRTVQLVRMHNAVYGIPPHVPVVQCYGIWQVLPTDPVDELFEPDTGDCRDRTRLIEAFKIALDEPRIAMLRPIYEQVHSNVYEGPVPRATMTGSTVNESYLQKVLDRVGTQFRMGLVGYAAANEVSADAKGYVGYDINYDINGDGVIDEQDVAIVAKHLGREVRYNLYMSAYFGGNWITTGSLGLATEHFMGIPVIADYAYGGGYDGNAGIIRLLRTPGPNRTVYVEYFHDAPAEAGDNNIRVHLYREV
jgi:hypothetical protein